MADLDMRPDLFFEFSLIAWCAGSGQRVLGHTKWHAGFVASRKGSIARHPRFSPEPADERDPRKPLGSENDQSYIGCVAEGK